MKKQLAILAICFAALSCDNNSDSDISPDTIIGFWSRETVYLNGVNSIAYVDFLNGGTNYINIKNDNTFDRAYDIGVWDLCNNTLTLKRDENTGSANWTYKIISHTGTNLILEMRLNESQYCCDFDSFNDSEIITIKEVYKKIN